ncbi:hypothetical protein [Myroides odoratus]|uniref:hypothetical protein n=1 Tax=Myroides odoratus TaxID=256 RepID=UPI003340276E
MRNQEFLDKQSFIIEATVTLEDYLNRILYVDVNSNRINIKGIEETKIFKNSSPVPIKTKIDLLYDLNYFEKDTYTRLIRQIEIRNIFAHNYSINNYLDCYKLIESKDLLKILYPPLKNNVSEENVEKAIANLFTENIKKLGIAVIEKNEFMLKTKKIHETYLFLINNYPDALLKVINKLESGDNIEALEIMKEKYLEYEAFLAKIEH